MMRLAKGEVAMRVEVWRASHRRHGQIALGLKSKSRIMSCWLASSSRGCIMAMRVNMQDVEKMGVAVKLWVRILETWMRGTARQCILVMHKGARSWTSQQKLERAQALLFEKLRAQLTGVSMACGTKLLGRALQSWAVDAARPCIHILKEAWQESRREQAMRSQERKKAFYEEQMRETLAWTSKLEAEVAAAAEMKIKQIVLRNMAYMVAMWRNAAVHNCITAMREHMLEFKSAQAERDGEHKIALHIMQRTMNDWTQLSVRHAFHAISENASIDMSEAVGIEWEKQAKQHHQEMELARRNGELEEERSNMVGEMKEDEDLIVEMSQKISELGLQVLTKIMMTWTQGTTRGCVLIMHENAKTFRRQRSVALLLMNKAMASWLRGTVRDCLNTMKSNLIQTLRQELAGNDAYYEQCHTEFAKMSKTELKQKKRELDALRDESLQEAKDRGNLLEELNQQLDMVSSLRDELAKCRLELSSERSLAPWSSWRCASCGAPETTPDSLVGLQRDALDESSSDLASDEESETETEDPFGAFGSPLSSPPQDPSKEEPGTTVEDVAVEHRRHASAREEAEKQQRERMIAGLYYLGSLLEKWMHGSLRGLLLTWRRTQRQVALAPD